MCTHTPTPAQTNNYDGKIIDPHLNSRSKNAHTAGHDGRAGDAAAVGPAVDAPSNAAPLGGGARLLGGLEKEQVGGDLLLDVRRPLLQVAVVVLQQVQADLQRHLRRRIRHLQ